MESPPTERCDTLLQFLNPRIFNNNSLGLKNTAHHTGRIDTLWGLICLQYFTENQMFSAQEMQFGYNWYEVKKDLLLLKFYQTVLQYLLATPYLGSKNFKKAVSL